METFEVQAVLSAIDKNFTSVMKEVQKLTDATTKTADNASKNLGKMNDSAKRGLPSIGNVVKGLGLFKVADAGINAVKNSLGGAIERFDKLSQFPKVLEALGASTSDAAEATDILKKGIDGLPTTLQDASSTAQQMFSVFKDGKKAANTTIALNNALLASGASGDAAARATDQYLKILRTGKVDLDSYGSLQENMSVGLDKLAAKFGFTGASAQNDLYKALQSGKVTIDDFNQGLYDIQGGLGGTAEIAKKSTEGIGTSMKNIGTAITTGLANSIKTINDTLKKQGFDNIFEMLNKVKGAISEGFNSFNAALPDILEKLGKAIKFVGDNADWIIPILSGVASSFVAFSAAEKSIKVITGIKEAFAEFEGISSLIGMIGPTGWIAIGIGAIVAASVFLYKNWDTVKQVASDVWNSVSEVFQVALDTIQPILDALSSVVTTTWSSITSFWTENQQTIMELVSVAWEAIKVTFETVMSYISFYIQTQLMAIQTAWEVLKTVLTITVQAMWAAISNVFTGALNAVLTVVTTILNQIKNVFALVTNTIQSIIKIFTSVFTGDWKGALDGVMQLVGGFKDFVVNSFKNITSMMSDLVRNGVETVKNIFGDLAKIDLFAAGKAIIGSLTKGMKEMWEDTKKFVGGIGDWIVQHKGPISYDKKMLIPAGLAIMEGFNKSLSSGFSNVQDNLLGMNDKLSDSFDMSTSLANANSSLNSTIQHEVNMGKAKQSATFNIRLGNQQFTAFVDDISQAMGNNAEINLAF